MNSKTTSIRRNTLTEEEIREYAYHLFVQSGGKPGHDLDHWLEAKARLEANIPRPHSRARLHHQLHHPEERQQGFTMPSSDALVVREAMEIDLGATARGK
jgi:hypothetical protein